MSDNDDRRGDDAGSADSRSGSESERGIELFGRGVRTALRTNATAYGFSISITSAYGMANGASGTASAGETVLFAAGAALAFVLIGVAFVANVPVGALRESGQVATISGAVDLLSITATVAAAFGLTRIPGTLVWPLTGLGTVGTYLVVGGMDVLIARSLASRTSFAREQ